MEHSSTHHTPDAVTRCPQAFQQLLHQLQSFMVHSCTKSKYQVSTCLALNGSPVHSSCARSSYQVSTSLAPIVQLVLFNCIMLLFNCIMLLFNHVLSLVLEALMLSPVQSAPYPLPVQSALIHSPVQSALIQSPVQSRVQSRNINP
jgi:hypothetical protein